MSSYLIAVIGKNDLDKYNRYMAAGFESIQGYDVEVITVENPEVLEGHFPGTSLVLLKFKNDEDAKKWYQSEKYQKAIPLRHESADTYFTVTFTSD